nr:MAG TPA: hypothetical protein [Caudoviricetes sp.]
MSKKRRHKHCVPRYSDYAIPRVWCSVSYFFAIW